MNSSDAELEIEKHYVDKTIEVFRNNEVQISKLEYGRTISYLAVTSNEVYVIDISQYDTLQEMNIDNYVKAIFE